MQGVSSDALELGFLSRGSFDWLGYVIHSVFFYN